MKNTTKHKRGFVAILSLLIIATIALIFSMSMLTDGISNASLSLNSIYYEDARLNSVTCLEDALLRIKKESQFNQNLNYNIFTNNSCSTSISWQGETQIKTGLTERLADLDVTGVSNGYTRKFRYSLRVAKFDVNNSDGSLKYMNSIDFISITELTT